MLTENPFSFIDLFFSEKNYLLTMFISAFLSSTILPGNSEIIFTTVAHKLTTAGQPLFSFATLALLLTATTGNALGSITTYLMGKLFPKPHYPQRRYAKLALSYSQKYGSIVLIFSWLPLVGDLLCAIAGWLKFPFWQTVFYILLGKCLRYLALLLSLHSLFT